MLHKQKHRMFQYKITLQVTNAYILLKFPCVFFLSWKVDKTVVEDNKKISPVNDSVLFNSQLITNMPIVYDQETKKFKEKKTLLHVNLNSANKPNESKLAGVVTIDIAKLMNNNELQQTYTVPIERCPDKNSRIEMCVRGELVKELDFNENSETSFSSSKFMSVNRMKSLANKSSDLNSSIGSIAESEIKQIKRDESLENKRFVQKSKTAEKPIGSSGIYERPNNPLDNFLKVDKEQEALKLDNTRLTNQNREINNKLKETETKIQFLEASKLPKLEKEVERLRTELDSSLKTLNLSVRRQEQTNKKMDQLTKEAQQTKMVFDKQKKGLQQEIEQLKQEVDRYRNKNTRLEDQLKNFKLVNQQKLRLIKQNHEQKLKEIQAQILEKEKTIRQHTSEILSLNRKLKTQSDAIAKQDLSKANEAESQNLEYEQQEYRRNEDMLKANLEIVESESVKLVKALKDKQLSDIQSRQSIAALNKQLQQKEQKLAEAITKLLLIEKEKQRMQAESKEADQTNKLNKQRVGGHSRMTSASKDSKQNSPNRKLITKRERIKDLENENKRQSEKLNELYVEIVNLNEIIYEHKQQSQDKDKLTVQLSRRIEQLEMELKESKSRLQIEKDNFFVENKQLIKQIETYERESQKYNSTHPSKRKEENLRIKTLEEELTKERNISIELQRRNAQMLAYIQEQRNEQLKLDQSLILKESELELLKSKPKLPVYEEEADSPERCLQLVVQKLEELQQQRITKQDIDKLSSLLELRIPSKLGEIRSKIQEIQAEVQKAKAKSLVSTRSVVEYMRGITVKLEQLQSCL